MEKYKMETCNQCKLRCDHRCKHLDICFNVKCLLKDILINEKKYYNNMCVICWLNKYDDYFSDEDGWEYISTEAQKLYGKGVYFGYHNEKTLREICPSLEISEEFLHSYRAIFNAGSIQGKQLKIN